MNGALVERLRSAALAYRALGFRLVPVAFKSKKPIDGDGWQTTRFRRDADQLREVWQRPHNIGVLLGPQSHDLTDVDLDCVEALELADEYLPAGAWIFGRASRPRSHRIYVSPGAHSITLKDLDHKEIVGLRAKPAGGEGHQTVFPPSVHESAEPITWDDNAGDGLELPSIIAPAVLSAAVRRLAVHAFLARYLGGIEGARSYLQHPRAGCLPRDVAAHARSLAGLPPAREPGKREAKPKLGDDVFKGLRERGIKAAAVLFDLKWDDRRRALVICPGCGMDTRSSKDHRAAAGVVKARETGVELAVHGKCGWTGDAVAVAAKAVLGTTKPYGREQWHELAEKLRERSAA